MTLADAPGNRFTSSTLADLIASLTNVAEPDVVSATFVRVGVETSNDNASGKSDPPVIVGLDTDDEGAPYAATDALGRLNAAQGSGRPGVDHFGGSEPNWSESHNAENGDQAQ